MVSGSSNNDEKRSSQEAMQELKPSDEPQGGELGVANFTEVRQTQKRARVAGVEGMPGRQHEYYNHFDDQPTQDMRQIAVQQSACMGEANEQVRPGMIATSPSGYESAPFRQPLGMAYGATGGQGLAGNAVAQHQIYMQNMPNGALKPYPVPATATRTRRSTS